LEVRLTTAIIGTGNIGSAVARMLARSGEPVVLAARNVARARGLAQELGNGVHAASVEHAIDAADVVVFAVWFGGLNGKVPDADEARTARDAR